MTLGAALLPPVENLRMVIGRDWMSPEAHTTSTCGDIGRAVSPFGAMALIALFIGSVWLA